MKRKLVLCFVLCLSSVWICLDAQNVKRPDPSYNYQRGMEAMDDNKYDEVIDCVFRRYPFTNSDDIRSL